MNYAIIAAGDGSRLKEEGIDLPKPLVRVNEMTLIERLIGIFLKNNADSISVIVNNEMKEVHRYLAALQLPVPFHVVIESTPSSMHSFYQLSPFLSGGKFCLSTVDTIFKESEFSSFIQTFMNDDENDGLMAVTEFIDDEKPLYVDVDLASRMIKSFDDTRNRHQQFISGGIYGLTNRALPILQQCMDEGIYRMRNYQRRLLTAGLRLKAFPFRKIIDVDHLTDIAKAEQFILS